MRLVTILGLAIVVLAGCRLGKQSSLPKELSAADLKILKDEIQLQVDAGFMPEKDIPAYAAQAIEGYEPKRVLQTARRYTRECISKHRYAQAKWPAVTDCDRLDKAFSALEKTGIVARQNFSDCQSCGKAEIWDEMEKVDDRTHAVRGYTFYHQQDTESAAQGYGIVLAYGSVEEGDPSSVAIGKEVVQALKQHGLKAEWNGSIKERI